MRQRATRCEVCKEVLFTGPSDPFQHYIGSLEIPWALEPVAVCMGPTFLGRWWQRRKWYHQSCCGIAIDTTNRAGQWYVFGGRLRNREGLVAQEVWDAHFEDRAEGLFCNDPQHGHQDREQARACYCTMAFGGHKWETEDDERAIRRTSGLTYCVHCGAERS